MHESILKTFSNDNRKDKIIKTDFMQIYGDIFIAEGDEQLR